MPDDTLKPALRAALRTHEIGSATPYKLFFAGKGKSGASFGFMQGDLAAGQARVTAVFRDILRNAGVSTAVTDSYVDRLSVHLISNPLSSAETREVNAALDANRPLVDQMDEEILRDVYKSLDTCIAAARAAGTTISGEALIYMAMWINMTGRPTKLLTWLSGRDPGLVRPVPTPGSVASGAEMEGYLRATSYYTENPGNLPHMLSSAAAGAALLPAMMTNEGDEMTTKSGSFWIGWANANAVNSSSLDALVEPFRSNAKAFIATLQAAGAVVDVTATKRHQHRAYLFHWSWLIGLGKVPPSQPDKVAAVDIQWDHGDLTASRAGAMEMVQGFGLAVPPNSTNAPSLTSLHIFGRAVDMDIQWSGNLNVKKKDGTSVSVPFMPNPNLNTQLHAVGASYGVKKLTTDKPHWSDNGH